MRLSGKATTLLILAAVIAIAPVFFPSSYYFRVGSLIFVNGLAVTGLVILIGYAGQISLGKRLRRGEQMADAQRLRRLDGRADTLHQAPDYGHRCLDRDLLTDDGAHRLFERIERHRQAQAGIASQQRREQFVSAQMQRNRLGLAVEIEHAPHALFELIQMRGRSQAAAQFQRVQTWQRGNPKPAGCAVEAEAAAVAVRAQ